MEPIPQGPHIIIRRRETETILTTQRVDRYWKHKETGVTVEVSRYLNVVGPATMGRRVVFFDPMIRVSVSMPEREFRMQYECIGNSSFKF